MNGKAPIEVWTRERCFITELLNSADFPEVSLARCRVEPGVTTEAHRLAVTECYVILQGTGRMMRGDEEPFAVAAGTTVVIPQQITQRITNTGADDLIFLCVCTSRFRSDCYTPVIIQEEFNDVWSESNKQ